MPQVTISLHHHLLTVPFALLPGTVSRLSVSLSYSLCLHPCTVFKTSSSACNYYRSVSSLKAFCVISECPSRFISSQQQLRCPHGLSAQRTALIPLPALSEANSTVGNFLSDCAIIEGKAVLSSLSPLLYSCHPPSTYRPLPQAAPYFLSHMSSIFDMSQSSSSTFQALFNAAVQDYKDKTGTSLIDHLIAQQLETCQSVVSITSILQEQAQSFRQFSENDGRLMKALHSSVEVLCTPSISSALNSAIGLVVRLKEFIQVTCS